MTFRTNDLGMINSIRHTKCVDPCGFNPSVVSVLMRKGGSKPKANTSPE